VVIVELLILDAVDEDDSSMHLLSPEMQALQDSSMAGQV